MKGNERVIQLLNEGLSAELTAINQYVIHGRMRTNWGYLKLAKHSHKESIDEMLHAQEFIDRILFLEGVPNMQKYRPINVGKDIKEQMELELREELDAVRMYNEGARVCREVHDIGSAELFEKLIKDEEGHTDYLETQLGIIESIGLPNYLAQQLEEEKK